MPKERFDRRWQWPLVRLGRSDADQGELMTKALLQYRRKLGGVLKTDGRQKQAMEALKHAEQEELRILTEEAFRMLQLSPQSLTEVGEAVQRDLRDWQDAHEGSGPGLRFPAVPALYTKARRIAEPRFEIADLKRAAQDVLRDAQGPSDKDTNYLCEIAAKILLVHPDLPSVTIESGRTFHAFDQLQAFREQIFDLTQFRTEHRPPCWPEISTRCLPRSFAILSTTIPLSWKPGKPRTAGSSACRSSSISTSRTAGGRPGLLPVSVI
jgi:hypothetical protein